MATQPEPQLPPAAGPTGNQLWDEAIRRDLEEQEAQRAVLRDMAERQRAQAERDRAAWEARLNTVWRTKYIPHQGQEIIAAHTDGRIATLEVKGPLLRFRWYRDRRELLYGTVYWNSDARYITDIFASVKKQGMGSFILYYITECLCGGVGTITTNSLSEEGEAFFGKSKFSFGARDSYFDSQVMSSKSEVPPLLGTLRLKFSGWRWTNSKSGS